MFIVLSFLLVGILFLGYFLGKRDERKKHAYKLKNPFIESHLFIMKRDEMYEKYKNWCYENKTFPLENFEFFSELENNKKLRDEVYKIMNG